MSTTMTTGTHAGSHVKGDWKETLGRVGLVGKGVLYGIIGILAIQLALGNAADTSQAGAIEWLADQPFGKFMLVLLTIALFAMAAWRFLDAWLGDPVEGSEATDRVKYAAQGVVYGAFAILSLVATVQNWSGAEDTSAAQSGGGQQKAASTVMEWPAGQWLVALAGVAVIGYALYQVKKHVIDGEFLERLDVGDDHWLSKLGRFGYAARAVVWGIVGWFLIDAGATYDKAEPQGLSAALWSLAGGGVGRAVLWVVAIGLIAFGLFTIAESKHRTAA